MPLILAPTWKHHFLTNKKLEYSNSLLTEIRTSINPSIEFSDSLKAISKNEGITRFSLDPNEEQLQLFHHPTILGGSWQAKDEKLVAILGFDADASPVLISLKSVKEVKGKTFSLDQLAAAADNKDSFMALKSPRMEFYYRNIVPLPRLLTKVFLELQETDPITAALAFFHAMYEFDSSLRYIKLHP